MAIKTKKLFAVRSKHPYLTKKEMDKLVDEGIAEMDHDMWVDEWTKKISKAMDEMNERDREELLRKLMKIKVSVPAIIMATVSDGVNKIREAAETILNSVGGEIDEMEILAEISQLADDAYDQLVKFVEIPKTDA